MDKQTKGIIIGVAIGLVVMYFITFMNIYNSQPHDHNCDRAREVCFFATPAPPPDEEPEPEPVEETPQEGDPCAGQQIPVAHTGSQLNANLYCSQFTCADTRAEHPEICAPVGTIFNPYERCECVELIFT